MKTLKGSQKKLSIGFTLVSLFFSSFVFAAGQKAEHFDLSCTTGGLTFWITFQKTAGKRYVLNSTMTEIKTLELSRVGYPLVNWGTQFDPMDGVKISGKVVGNIYTLTVIQKGELRLFLTIRMENAVRLASYDAELNRTATQDTLHFPATIYARLPVDPQYLEEGESFTHVDHWPKAKQEQKCILEAGSFLY